MFVSAPRVREKHTFSSCRVQDTPLLGVQQEFLCWLACREPIEGIGFHLDQTIIWRRRTCRTSVRMFDIGRICLAIRTQNEAEISICGIEMFYV